MCCVEFGVLHLEPDVAAVDRTASLRTRACRRTPAAFLYHAACRRQNSNMVCPSLLMVFLVIIHVSDASLNMQRYREFELYQGLHGR